MTAKTIPRLMTLKQAAEALGGNIPASTLRSEVLAGRLRCVRARPGCNSPILLADEAIVSWLEKYAGTRQAALSPREAGEANKASRASH
jgi:hypothetical protein